jgi:hypothetical protein
MSKYTIDIPLKTNSMYFIRSLELYAPINVNPQGGHMWGCIHTLGILISILAPSWGNLNRMTFINIEFIAIYCKMLGHLTNIYCPTVAHLIENLLKK